MIITGGTWIAMATRPRSSPVGRSPILAPCTTPVTTPYTRSSRTAPPRREHQVTELSHRVRPTAVARIGLTRSAASSVCIRSTAEIAYAAASSPA